MCFVKQPTFVFKIAKMRIFDCPSCLCKSASPRALKPFHHTNRSLIERYFHEDLATAETPIHSSIKSSSTFERGFAVLSGTTPRKSTTSDSKTDTHRYRESIAFLDMHRTLLALLLLAPAIVSAGTTDQIATISHEARKGSPVPGDSPVRYCSNPANDSFQISSLDMYPNPCVM